MADDQMHLAPGHRVLHHVWGLGKVTQPPSNATVRVEFPSGIQDVPKASLHQVLTLTALARMIEGLSEVSAWTVRKAHEQGAIQPNAVGRFAGHRVHYYDAARIPELVAALSRRQCWTIGTLVMHAVHGPGTICGYGPQPHVSRADASEFRLVEFFCSSRTVLVSVEELRSLVPSHTVARRVGANRRTFRKLAARRGIYPDYIAPQGRVREFYDEIRIEAISDTWARGTRTDSRSPGSIVLNAEGEPGTIVSRDASGQTQLRSVQSPAYVESTHVEALQELVSMRELARRQNMSRYKLSRLLDAVKVSPAHRSGKTLYFDRVRAEQALAMRLKCERSALPLVTLAVRTGISEPVLARKVRAGCIRTLGQHATHYVALAEADRVQQVIKALRSCSSIQSLGICRLHPRGRTGHEVAAWDLTMLVKVCSNLSEGQQTIVFGQVAWLAEGAGRRRLREAFDQYFESIQQSGDQRHIRRTAKCLLALIESLSAEFSRYRIRLLLLASGALQDYAALEHGISRLADQSGCDHKRAFERFRSHIDERLLDLLQQERHTCNSADPVLDDDCRRGAVLISGSDRKPQVGIVRDVEQQCWNALLRCWHKTVLVGFRECDRRIRVDTRPAGASAQSDGPPMLLLPISEVAKLRQLLREGCPADLTGDELRHRNMVKLAS